MDANEIRRQQKAAGSVLIHFIKGGMSKACGTRANVATRNPAEVTCQKCQASPAWQRAAK